MTDNKKPFDQNEYIKSYNKEKYTSCNLRIKPDDAVQITEYSKKVGMSRASFFVACCKYIIENNIDISENAEK